MVRLFLAIFILLYISTASSAQQFAELDSETAEELLLFYDWEDLLVDAPSRRPTKIRYVAENISIITAGEIREMNPHSVSEILRIVSGLDLEFRGGHFGGNSSLGIHGSAYEHVLLLLDGVRLNDVDAGYPEPGGIPVQIIDRIEIIKGPASSAWGSSLGGVINIITRETGRNSRPTVTLYGSHGEGPSVDYRAQAAGRAGKGGYYLHGGYMDSDGLVDDRYFKNKSFYGKITTGPAKDISLTFTAGYWYPDLKDFDLPGSDLSYMTDVENYLATGKLRAALTPELKFDFDLYYRGQKWRNHFETLSTGEMIEDRIWDNDAWGGSIHLTLETERHTMLFGTEFSRGKNERTWTYASSPSVNLGKETRKDWALYFNDTIKWEKLAVTPGLRYDHLSIVDASYDDIISPSVGATYKVTDDTLLRATAARGFIRPAIGLTVGAAGYAGDPDLEPEDIWSVQAGIESARFAHVHLKADVFYHYQDGTWYWNDSAGLYVNGGVSRRTGYDVSAAVSPFEHFTGSIGYTYVRVEPYNRDNNSFYTLTAKMRYSPEHAGSLTLFGRYAWLSQYLSVPTGRYDDMIWDLHYNRDVFSHDSAALHVFFSVRNLFNGAHYYDAYFIDPERWVEGGVRISF